MKMKRLFAVISLMAAVSGVSAQVYESLSVVTEECTTQPTTHSVYAELVGMGTFGFNKSITVNVDLGQYQSAAKNYTLLDEKGKAIKFNSMVAAMNYMGERGWKFVQVYTVRDSSGSEVNHWLMYKEVSDESEIYDGIRVKNTDSGR